MSELVKDERERHAREMIVEAMCVHEGLVRLGFAPDQIQIHLGHTSTPTLAIYPERTATYDVCVFVGLKDGLKSWRVCVGPTAIDGIAFHRILGKVSRELVGASHAEGRLTFERSRTKALLPGFLEVIKSKGIRIPREAGEVKTGTLQ